MPRPIEPRRVKGTGAAAVLAAALLAAYAPPLLRSGLRQGDLPGHLEAMRAYAEWIWPAPWGWDPRFLLGAPLGILYPPLFHWLGGGLGKILGVEGAMRLLILAAVAALPFAFVRAARGLGLRRDEAGWAAGGAVAVLCLPGRGLGGSLHQTFVAGNAANAFALPLLLFFLSELRPALRRPGRWRRAAATLALTLLSHFLMGLAGLAALAAYGLAGSHRRRLASIGRAVRIGLVAALLAAPLLVPFLAHWDDGAAGAIPFSPPPGGAEWGALAALVAGVAAGGRRARRALFPAVLALAVLYALRGAVFPLLGEPSFRMEYHRFRLFLYLALVPATAFVLARIASRRRRRIAGFALGLAVPCLAVVALRYDARGPAAPAMPSAAVSLTGKRILVVASPFAQGGSWHGLQCSLPGALGATGAKGLFVEASPASKAVFEIERWVSPPGARPRWWAIRLDDDGSPPSTDRVRSRLHDLGIDAIVTLEGISAAASEALRGSPVDLGNGWALYPVDAASEFRIGRDRIDLRLAASGAEETVAIPVNPFPDWRVRSGDATIATRGVPRDPALVVRGRGSVTLGIGPRGEEWTGLALGLATAVAAAASGRAAARRRRLAPYTPPS